jgi:thiamine-phosphate pyrophosphorylase
LIRYQITDGTAHINEDRWLAAINREADFVQIREGHLTTRDLCRLVRKVGSGTRVLVNDRIDLAIACQAAGVHLRSGSIAPELVRTIVPRGFLITVACHDAEDVQNAAGADYVLLAPVFKPISKQDGREPLGLTRLAEITRTSPAPVIALGGITESNMGLCIEAGAAGAAGITFFRDFGTGK